MAFPIFSSLPFTFNKTLFPKHGSISLPILNSNFHRPIQCKATYEAANNQNQTVPTGSYKFQPSIWNNDYIQSLSSEYKEEMYAEKRKVLRENVRMMFKKIENEVDQLEFIDVLQRLGVDYNFNNEIRDMLDNIYKTQTFKLTKQNLYFTALKFRLLRQHGYDVSTDVFVCFQDEMCDLKKNKPIDVVGILSMYEASFHSFENETIMDEARDFTTKFLKDYLNQYRDNHIMSLQINHALELPLHWRIPRWETQWFINIYERQQKNNTDLLEFAKLDYNIVQNIYREELKYTSRWWTESELGEKLSFARDRIVESYVWTVGTNFKPDFDYFRKVITKLNALITIIDDVYDVYGTLEELELFTEAIDRWDLNGMDSLPYYMKICFYTLYNSVNEVGFEAMNNNGYHITPYLKKSWTNLCKAYLVEAKWYNSGYKPRLEEYIENAWISIGAPITLIYTYFLIPHSFRQEDLVCLEQNPNIIRYPSLILRLANDLGTSKRESETGDIPKSIQCYQNETGVSETEAHEHVKSMIIMVWKKMNKEAHTSSFSRRFIDIAINAGRMALCMYMHGDGHTIQDLDTKNRIMSLIFESIPIVSSNDEFERKSNAGELVKDNEHVTNNQEKLDGDHTI